MTKNPSQHYDCDFMEGAIIPKFNPSKVPKLGYQQDCNDDIRLGSFQPSKFVWAGLQKKGVSPLIEDPKDYIDHILRATIAVSPLTVDMPLHGEITEPLKFLMYKDRAEIVKFWGEKIVRL